MSLGRPDWNNIQDCVDYILAGFQYGLGKKSTRKGSNYPAS
jgi:hypothetical protein